MRSPKSSPHESLFPQLHQQGFRIFHGRSGGPAGFYRALRGSQGAGVITTAPQETGEQEIMVGKGFAVARYFMIRAPTRRVGRSWGNACK